MIANKVIDIFDDRKKTVLKKIAHKIPEDIIHHHIVSPENGDGYALRVLTKQGFIMNKFPCDSRTNTYLSTLYFDETHECLPKTAAHIAAYNLKTACEKFNIPVTKAIEKLAHPTNTNFFNEMDCAKEEKRTLYVNDRPDHDSKYYYALPELKKYAMPTKQFIKKAERYFEENYKAFSPEQRVEYCKNLVGRAAELGVATKSDLVHKYASAKYSNKIKQNLKMRELLCKNASHIQVLRKMASLIDETDPIEFANALYEFDKKTGIIKYYDTKIKDAFLSTLGPEKFNKEASYVYKEPKTGINLSAKELKDCFQNKQDKLSEYLGRKLAENLKKGGIEAFEALPDEIKRVIAGIAVGSVG